MTIPARVLLKWIAPAMMLAVAACGGPYVPPSTVKAPTVPEAEEVFAAGYGGITEKYIDIVSVEDVALEGLRGLGAIDPDLTVERVGALVTLSVGGEAVVHRRIPEPHDVRGWASVTAQLATEARSRSRQMAAANAEKVYEAVFDGVLSELDIYSRYAGAEEARRNRAKRDGFGGIGVRIRITDGAVRITKVMANTPAAKAGLEKNDRITHIDGQLVEGLKAKNVAGMLRGPTHSTVGLTVRRPGQEVSRLVELERAHIVPQTVFTNYDDGILSVRISSFNQDTSRTLAEALTKAKTLHAEMKGVVLDLRGNPGGLLKQSVKVADLLLTQGHISSTKGRHPDSLHHYEAGGGDLADGLPIAILLDGKSASAAEIVAAALQDRDRAVVIGTSSFGKGTVQTVLRLPNDGEITLTWSRLMAPSGYVLHGLGVHPAICTSGLSDDVADDGLVTDQLASELATRETLGAWRTPGLQEKQRRTELRGTCPAERRRAGLEARVAKYLLADEKIFARALSLTSAHHQARN